MILVVACAVAMAIIKQANPWESLYPNESTTLTVSISMSAGVWVQFWFEKWISPMLGALTVGLLVIRLRRPRPPFCRLFQQPGVMALTLSTLAMFLEGLIVLGSYLVSATGIFSRYPPHFNYPLRLSELLQEATSLGGTLILGSWLTLALSWRFRCTPEWIEQVSILLGACWIAAFLIPWTCYHILYFTI
jgi:hypothetical protein